MPGECRWLGQSLRSDVKGASSGASVVVGVDVEGVEGPGTQGGNKGVSQISGFRDATNIAGWKMGRPLSVNRR